MIEKKVGFSSIATRLRTVLLIVGILVIAQPVLVYFSTNRVISKQADVTSKLIQAEVRAAQLLRQVNAIALQGRNIQFLDSTDQLRQISTSLESDIEVLVSEFSQLMGGNEQGTAFLEIRDQLEIYRSLIREVANAHILQIDYRTQLHDKILSVNQTVSDKLSLLGPVIVERQIELDGHINALEFEDIQAGTVAIRQAFSALITLNNIADAVDAEQYFLSTIERGKDVQHPKNLQVRLRSQTQSLAVQIAKLPSGEAKSALARYTLEMMEDLFGPEGIFDQIELYQEVKAQGETSIEKQQTLVARLLQMSQSMTDEAQEEFITTSQQADALVARTRFFTNLMAALIGLLIICLIFFVVERQFNARIRKLTSRVLAIANGQHDPGGPDYTNDELSAMGDALEVFKRNATELGDSNETLVRRNAEIQQLGTRLETVLDTASSGIIAFDSEGRIILANRPARHFLGGTSAQTPFNRPDEITFLDREDLSPLDASSDPINRVIAGKILHHEIALIKREGRGDGRYVRITSNRVDDPASNVRMVLAIDDVSEAEQNRQQIERTSRLDALGQLTGGIAHDFNNLLATIQYAIKLSSGGVNPEKRAKYHKIALDSVERGAQLSSRLLSFAKRQPGVSKSHKVKEILSDFEELIAPTIEAAITIDLLNDDLGMSVYCDRAQLENALLNLVLNARDAILRENSGDKITVAVRSVTELRTSDVGSKMESNRHPTNALEAELRAQDDDSRDRSYRYIDFIISDNGPGMSDEVKKRALDPFFTTKSRNSSTGLGLSMVYGFVQQSGGKMRVYSELGLGTTIQLLLPRGSEDNEREKPILRNTPIKGNGQRILVVEDETYLREAMNDLIIDLGYEVSVASSGREALKLIEDGLEVDLLLTDIVMPGGIGGFDLAARAREVLPQIPILYMSGYAAYTDREMGVVIAPLLQKPCSPHVLAKRLNEALG